MKWNEIEMEWNVMKPHMMTGTYEKKEYGELSQKMPTPNEMKWTEPHMMTDTHMKKKWYFGELSQKMPTPLKLIKKWHMKGIQYDSLECCAYSTWWDVT